MDNPGDAKYGMTTEQIFEAFKQLKELGVKEFGIHSFLASNTVTNEYYPTLAKQLFELAVKIKKKKLEFISDLSTYLVESESLTFQIRKVMTSLSLVKVYTKYMTKY